jgi:hypothetical protein
LVENKWLNYLEKKLGKYAIENVTIFLVIGQSLIFTLSLSKPEYVSELLFIPKYILEGQIWRLFTFVFIPFSFHPLLALFFWYLFYIMGTALEQYWGSFKLNLFFLIGYIATVCTAFIQPLYHSSNTFLYLSVFLAFAYIAPNFIIHIFFIFPVRIKWFALITWFVYGYSFISGNGITRINILAALVNFLFFFGYDFVLRAKSLKWRMKSRVEDFNEKKMPRHTCTVCGKNSNLNPEIDFRYCMECKGQKGYCPDHISNHKHQD